MRSSVFRRDKERLCAFVMINIPHILTYGDYIPLI